MLWKLLTKHGGLVATFEDFANALALDGRQLDLVNRPYASFQSASFVRYRLASESFNSHSQPANALSHWV